MRMAVEPKKWRIVGGVDIHSETHHVAVALMKAGAGRPRVSCYRAARVDAALPLRFSVTL
jgi:hypothetical protein